jgi:hypothetical protein
VAAILAGACTTPKDRPTHPRFFVNGTIPYEDVKYITFVVEKKGPTHPTTYRIDVKSPTSVEVYTDPTQGKGTVLVMEKQKTRWVITGTRPWGE